MDLAPFKAAAATSGIQAVAAPVRDKSELASAVAALANNPNGGLITMPDSFLTTHSADVISLAARHGSDPMVRTFMA